MRETALLILLVNEKEAKKMREKFCQKTTQKMDSLIYDWIYYERVREGQFNAPKKLLTKNQRNKTI